MTVICAFYVALNTKNILLSKEQLKLLTIANTLEHRLLLPYERILRQENALDATTEEKRKILNQYLQPIIDEVARKYPDGSAGYYSPDLNLLAVYPFKPELLGNRISDKALKIYDIKEVIIDFYDSSIAWPSKPMLAVSCPLFYDGKLIGHVWASTKTEHIDNEIISCVLESLGVILLLWIGVMGTMWWVFRKMDKGLKILVNQIEEGESNPQQFSDFPQLISVFKTVVELREKIKGDFLENEKIKEKIIKLDRLNLISQMACGVAHEIRNPLQVVMGYLQFMSLKAEGKSKSQISLIVDELKSVNELITDFLSVARDKRVERAMLQLNSIIYESSLLIYPEAIKNGIDIQLKLDKSLPQLYLDKKEIKQLILNLTQNAIQAMGDKGVVEITTVSQSGKVQLSISDTGIGISPEQLEKIFDPFFTTKDSGTGLGLAVCKSIIERHNGEIVVESREGIGTTFTITFYTN